MAAKPPLQDNTGASSIRLIGLLLGTLVAIAIASYFFWKPAPQQEPLVQLKPTETVTSPPAKQDTPKTNDTDFEGLADLEQIQTTLTERLKKLSAKYTGTERLKSEQVGQFISSDFKASPLVQDQLETVFQRETSENALTTLNVQRLRTTDQKGNSHEEGSHTQKSSSLVDFQGFMHSILQPIAGNSPESRLRSKFKIFRIQRNGQTLHTEVLGSFFANNSQQQSGEFNATFIIDWVQTEASSYPLISKIDIVDYESATHRGATSVGFLDSTANLLGNDPKLTEQFGQGAEQWTARIADHGIFGYNGICVGDVNGDGLDDAYLCQPYGLPNRLLIQQPDGTAKDLSAEWGVDLSEHTRSGLLIDIDNDSRQDLVVGVANGLLIYRNNGSRFEIASEHPEIQDPYSICSADFDNDGDLDIYVCGYYDKYAEGRRFPFAFPMHDSNSGGPNTLLRNEGEFRFLDVTKQVGLDNDNTKYTYAAGWQDFDNDGDQDLYVANDYGRNCFYVFQDGQFTNRAAEFEVEDQSFGMSVDWADIDHNGIMDLYISNMYSTAGNRVSFQDNYLSQRPDLQNRMQYMARGNSLFLGTEQGFEDIGGTANVFMGRWAWGSKFVDMNNDGWDDIVVPNGFLTRKISDDL